MLPLSSDRFVQAIKSRNNFPLAFDTLSLLVSGRVTGVASFSVIQLYNELQIMGNYVQNMRVMNLNNELGDQRHYN